MKMIKQNGFTLTELLVVIVIIGLIAAIALPAIARAKIRSKAAVTRVEMKSLEGAIKSYKADYERFPIGSNRPPHPYLDYTGGEVKGTSWKMKNSDMMYILLAEDGGGNAKHARNPKKKKYVSPKDSGTATDVQGIPGLSASKIYRSPFGNEFIVTMDVNRNGYCGDFYYGSTNRFTNSVAGLVIDRSLRSKAGDYHSLRGDVMIWTAGPDKLIESDPKAAGTANPDIDNILSWQ